MLQVRVHGPGDVRLDDIADPDLGPGDALVRIAACGVCGTDLSSIRMGGIAGPGPEPLCLGHEAAGTVEQVGAEVRTVRVGDRVVLQPGCDELDRIGAGAPQGALTPVLHVPDADRRLHPVPGHVGLDVAALAEPLAVGMHAADQARVQPGQTVAVFGCGPIGLAAIATLTDRGHDRVVGIDPSAARRELALGLGAEAALDPTTDDVWASLAAHHGAKPFMFGPMPATDAFIEATGVDAVLTDIIGNAGPSATVSVVALHYQPVPTSFLLVLMKELTLRGSIEYPPRFADAIDLLARRDLSGLITHRFALDRFDDALGELSGSKDCGKVLIEVDPTQW
ncbi:MAG: alcohol dehydrogenase catalytic domain-containing protein [Acidimicrobiales bacterium]